MAYLDDPRDFPGQTIDRKRLQEKLGWLNDYRWALAAWAELLAIAEQAARYIRRKGYHRHAARELKSRLLALVRTPGGLRLQAGIVAFVREQSRCVKAGQHLLGSSEILESLLGKYKRIQGTHSKGGMTGSLLNIGAAVLQKTSDSIRQGLAAAPVAAVGKWIRENLGLTIPAQQALAFQRNKSCPKNQTFLMPSF